jgi:hypothetical protein
MIEKELHQTEGGGGGVSNPNVKKEAKDTSLWWVGGFLLALILLAILLAII